MPSLLTTSDHIEAFSFLELGHGGWIGPRYLMQTGKIGFCSLLFVQAWDSALSATEIRARLFRDAKWYIISCCSLGSASYLVDYYSTALIHKFKSFRRHSKLATWSSRSSSRFLSSQSYSFLLPLEMCSWWVLKKIWSSVRISLFKGGHSSKMFAPKGQEGVVPAPAAQ